MKASKQLVLIISLKLMRTQTFAQIDLTESKTLGKVKRGPVFKAELTEL
jgi:hypothetical protein